MPGDAWDIISADGTFEVVLHLLEDADIDEGMLRQRKRKKPHKEPDVGGLEPALPSSNLDPEAQGVPTLNLGGNTRTQEASIMLRQILDGV